MLSETCCYNDILFIHHSLDTSLFLFMMLIYSTILIFLFHGECARVKTNCVLVYTLGDVSHEAVVDIGCFSTRFANSNPYYKLTQGLPWEKGVAVCDERLTKYVGVQAEPG